VRAGEASQEDVLSRARPVAVVTEAGLDGELQWHAPSAPRTVAEAAGLLLFTSGSSGVPKGVVLGKAGIEANVDAILSYLPVAHFSTTALVLPMSYSYALVGQALVTLRAGGRLLLLNDVPFASTQVEAMANEGATGLSSVPTSLRLICQAALELAPGDRPPLGYMASAGAPLDEKTRGLMKDAFPDAQRFNQYGLTEACPRVTGLSDAEPAFAHGSVGRPLPGITVTAVTPDGTPLPPGEVGELLVQGPSVMLGYLDDPEGTARVLTPDGLRAGDRGYVDADGFVFVLGREDGVVKVAGERISVEEVAAVLRLAPGVREACVVAVPDELMGAHLVAFIEPQPGVDATPAVREAARQRLSAARRPRRVVQLAELPRGANGKLDLAALRAIALAPGPQ
jgi:acyl-coenzyme A synthetase/AMP-(fatty) acid ligase